MPRPLPSRFFRYGLSVASSLSAFLITLNVGAVQGRIPFAPFFLSVLVSALYGGLGPGLLAVALSAAAGGYLISETGDLLAFRLAELIQLGVFLVVALTISFLTAARQRAEESRRLSEEEYRLLFEKNPLPMWLFDRETLCFLAVNEAAVNHYGYTREEFLGLTLKDIRPPETVPDLMKALSQRHTGLHFAGTIKHRQKDGTLIDVDVTSQPLIFRGRSAELVLAHDVTERNRSEETRRQLAAVVESSDDAIISKSLDGIITSWNRGAERIYGYAAEEAVGQPISILNPPDYENDARQMLERIRRGEHIEQYETVRVSIGGRLIDVSITVSPIKDSSGKITGASVVARDISERKRAEEEKARLAAQVAAQRQRLSDIIVSVPGAVWEAWGQPDAPAQRIDYVNDYVEQMLGYSVREWLSTPNFWLLIVHPEDKERVGREAAAMYASGGSSTLQFRWMAKDERAIWVEARCAVIKNEQGDPVGMRGVTFDISERKRAEEALHEADSRAILEYQRLLGRITSLAETLGTARELKTIFRALKDFALISTSASGLFISLYDPERNIRTAAYAWSEGEEEDISSLPPFPITESPNSRAVITGQVIITDDFQAATAGQPVVNLGLDRDPRLPQSSLVVPMAVMGRVIGAVEVQSVERAAYNQGHATVMRMAANLAAVAIENMRLLEREREQAEQLRQSQKLEAVGQLAGGVAHDFNNLLTVITGYSDLLLRHLNQDDPLRQKVEEIRKAAERATSLTRQLLAFSRKQILQPKVFHLNSLVTDTSKMLRRLIGEDIEFITLLKPEAGRINADPGQIEQVLMNLVVNARAAMPHGGKLVIETANVELDKQYADMRMGIQPGQYVMLAVSDTGVGMNEETQARIFEPFFTTKEVGKGTGLGLSTVYGIIKQTGGNIWVYSEVGKGTTFKIYLPRAEEGMAASAAAARVEAPRGTEMILLVEDQPMVRALAREILQEAGYQVWEAANGEEAIRICEQHKRDIHLMLTDVVMPLISGRQLAERVAPLQPQMRVLYMSGYTDDAIVHHGVLDPGTAFLEKPFTPDALLKKVREVLDEALA